MPTHDLDAPLVVRPSLKRQLPLAAVFGVLVCVYVVLGVSGVVPGWIAVLGVVASGTVLVVCAVNLRKARRAEWELRLDGSGVTVRGHETVPWTDIAEVRVSGMKPRWLFWFSLGFRVVSFIGRPGVQLPSLPSESSEGFLAKTFGPQHERFYGTRLGVMPYAMDATATTITAAVRRWSDVPVR